MNINQVGKLFSDKQNQEVRTLELRIGQVVRGVVTQQLPNQEALVNINGVQVKAKLEVPIMEGQATLMEVAPNSKEGFIHLKQVDPAKMGLHDPMKDLLKAMQLPDKDWSNQLVRELRQEGFPLNKDTMQALAQAAKAVPPNVDLETWMQSAALAFKRGMPMTFASISAMHQLSQGQPLHQLINQLQQQLTQLFQLQGQQLSHHSSQLLQQLSQSLTQLMNNNQVAAQSQPQQQAQQPTMQPSGQAPSSQATGQVQANQASSNLAQANPSPLAQGQTAQPVSQANTMQNPIVTFMKLLGVQHENVLSQQIIQKGEILHSSQQQGQIANQATGPQAQGNGQVAGQQHNNQQQGITQSTQQTMTSQQLGVQQQAVQQTGQTPQTTQVAQQSLVTQQPLVQQPMSAQVSAQQQPNLQQVAQMQAVNQDQASQITQSTNQAVTTPLGQPSIANQQGVQPFIQTHVVSQGDRDFSILPQANHIVSQSSESVKATVLQALQMADIPATVKESMTQLVNHITGQQMMLSTERNHSVFTHLTMYIPIKDDNGEQTAAVHVQTRRDRKGQLDAENCRIVFDLNMKQLGETLVDMNVVNKIVSINVWNDASYIQPLIDSMRAEIVESMQKTGYSLSSIKTSSFTQREQAELNEAKTIINPPDVQHMNASRYKGVDIKV